MASGLLLDVVMAALFGAGSDTDAFVAAARLPFALTAVLMVLSTQVLVPNFAVWFTALRGGRGRRIDTTILVAGLLAGLITAGVLAAAADPLLHVVAPGFSSAQHDLAVSLSRVMVLMIPMTAGSEVLRAWLNARHSYLIPAGMTLLLNVTAVSVLAFSGGESVRWIAAAYLAGAAVQFAAMMAIAFSRGFRLGRPTLRDSEVRRVGRMVVRPAVGAGLNPLVRVAETFVASFLPAGSITIVHYGNRVVSAVGGTVLFRSVMVATLPRLAKAFARGSREASSGLARLTLRVMAAISFPLTGLGVVLALPLTVAVFGRGEFAGDAAQLLGLTLAVYALSFIGSGMQRGLLAPFYATRDTRVPLANTVWGVAANLVLLPICVLPFVESEWGVLAIAAAYSLAQYANVGHAARRLRRSELVDLSGIGRSLWRSAAAAAAGTAVAGAVLIGLSASVAGWLDDTLVTLLGALLALAAGLTAVLAVELSDPQLRAAARRRVRRLGKKAPTE